MQARLKLHLARVGYNSTKGLLDEDEANKPGVLDASFRERIATLKSFVTYLEQLSIENLPGEQRILKIIDDFFASAGKDGKSSILQKMHVVFAFYAWFAAGKLTAANTVKEIIENYLDEQTPNAVVEEKLKRFNDLEKLLVPTPQLTPEFSELIVSYLNADAENAKHIALKINPNAVALLSPADVRAPEPEIKAEPVVPSLQQQTKAAPVSQQSLAKAPLGQRLSLDDLLRDDDEEENDLLETKKTPQQSVAVASLPPVVTIPAKIEIASPATAEKPAASVESAEEKSPSSTGSSPRSVSEEAPLIAKRSRTIGELFTAFCRGAAAIIGKIVRKLCCCFCSQPEEDDKKKDEKPNLRVTIPKDNGTSSSYAGSLRPVGGGTAKPQQGSTIKVLYAGGSGTVVKRATIPAGIEVRSVQGFRPSSP